jgi:hypothetical protein
MRHRQDKLGERTHARVELQRPGFIIPAPDAPWIECRIIDISAGGVCVDVGSLVIPDIFGLSFDARGTVVRVCLSKWRNGPMIGARFVTAKELREGPGLQDRPTTPTAP